MNIKLRAMTPEEFAKYTEFSFQNFVNELTQSSEKSFNEALKTAGGPPTKATVNDIWRVICFSEKIIGFIWIQLFPDKDKAFGYDIYLDEGYRLKGIGRLVMEKCRLLLKNKGIKTVDICVFEGNKIARNLYSSFGFKEKSYNENKRQYRLEIEL